MIFCGKSNALFSEHYKFYDNYLQENNKIYFLCWHTYYIYIYIYGKIYYIFVIFFIIIIKKNKIIITSVNTGAIAPVCTHFFELY